MAPTIAAHIGQQVIKSAINGTDSTRHPSLRTHKHDGFHRRRNDFLTNLQLITCAVLFLIIVVLFIQFLSRMILWNTEFAFAARMEAAEERERQAAVARQQADVEGRSLRGPWEDNGLLEIDDGDKLDTQAVLQTSEGRLRI